MHYKKIVVMPATFLFIGGVMYSLYAFIGAFGALQENFLYDGSVAAKAEDAVMLLTPTEETITVRIAEETKFADELSLEAINTGDCLKISAAHSGSAIIAKNIEKINCGTSYGYR